MTISDSTSTAKPSVLFVCVHNAGRSQMAAGFMTHLGQGRVEVLSAGSAPKDSINPVAVEAMAEVGIDISHNSPKVLTPEAVQQSDAVITMGCGDACPFYPGKGMRIGFLKIRQGKELKVFELFVMTSSCGSKLC